MKAILRDLKRTAKRILQTLDDVFVRLGAANRFLAKLYYLLNGRYGREQQANLSGKLAYKKSLSDPSINTSLLRRNIHRLEKGLLMRPRRVPFGVSYIGETVLAYRNAVSSGTEGDELRWAHDVLSEYMNVTPNHEAVDGFRSIMNSVRHPSPGGPADARRLIPYTRLESDMPQVGIDDLLKLAKHRRSVRWYRPDPIPRDAIDRAIEIASYSPTACNRQPYEFRIFDDPELVSRIISIPMGTTGFAEQVPAVAVVVGRQRNYPADRDRHLIYVDGSLAAMSFVYGLEVQGLSSCCINWPDIEALERKMECELQLASDERPIMLIAFGYPDLSGLVANSTKKPLSTICKYNFEK
ncbi:nitroreductase family protein [Stenotrophomonas lactitubi]|uniref:nitroreductase family protein n=1 Tax=Stenotrophomonas TaxID=40323 RepID=UPI0013DC84AA|nr:nitroreductase family protein [Stenotrophomonas lactitubi]